MLCCLHLIWDIPAKHAAVHESCSGIARVLVWQSSKAEMFCMCAWVLDSTYSRNLLAMIAYASCGSFVVRRPSRWVRGTEPPGSTLNPLCHAPVCGRMSLRALPVSFLAFVEGSLEHVCTPVCAKCGQTVWGCLRLLMLLSLLLLSCFCSRHC